MNCSFAIKTVLFVILLLSLSTGSASEISHAAGDSVRFIALGDQGSGGKGQRDVAEAMNRKATEDPVEFVILLGDNFYWSGVESVDDPQWDTKFEKMYSYPSLQVPFYAVLGNHDHYGNPLAQVRYTRKSTRWKMPAAYYTFSVMIDNSQQVQFFALDTTSLYYQEQAPIDQLQWLNEQLRTSKAEWKIVYGHHPVYSSGSYGIDQHLVKVLEPVFRKYKVDLYMSGHDHDLELMRSGSGTFYLISGAGSDTRPVKAGDNSIFASSSRGFAWISILKDELTIQFISVNGSTEYEYRIKRNR
jgi:acid phosphatase